MQRVSEVPAAVLRRVVGPALKHVPLTRAAVRGSMNAIFRVALLPFGRNRPRGAAREAPDLIAGTDRLNRAAEHYYTAFDETAFLLGKPFTDELSLPRHLFSLGVLLDGLRLRRSDVVIEFGAGTCWVSHFLNRFGCRTISLDVSGTALNLGKQLFDRDPNTNWSLEPEFLAYDGRRIPLADGSCDKIIVFDAFHHVPNQREILCEFRRVLKADGIVAMSEPGRGHAATQASQNEVSKYGVLENELVVEDLAALALDCGFAAANLIVASPDAAWEIPARDLGPFIQGKGFTRFWEHHSDALLAGHYILLYKGDPRPTTRQPKAIGAHIQLANGSKRLTVKAGSSLPIRLKLTNTSETRWLGGRRDDGGWTRLGGHLYRVDTERHLVDFDWLRVELPQDVDQHKTIALTVEMPPMASPGTYEVVFDLVIEGVTWFADRGSMTATAIVDVRA
ncbi:MAG: class I SAM-dependent methyltransferase [Acidobacteriota bacterium]